MQNTIRIRHFFRDSQFENSFSFWSRFNQFRGVEEVAIDSLYYWSEPLGSF